MIVTKLVEVTQARSKVYIDNEFAFVLYKGELRLYHIKEGAEVDKEDYRVILEEVLPKRAKLRCMNLLKSREYTEKQLRDKLRMGDYPENMITIALDYVKSYGYVDDVRYTENYIVYNADYKSRKRMEQDLLKKGVSKEIITQSFLNLEEEKFPEREWELLLKQIEKRHYQKETATREETQKLFAYLYRKGFSVDLIRKALVGLADMDI